MGDRLYGCRLSADCSRVRLQRVINKAPLVAFSTPMLSHAVAVRLKVPRIELPPTVPLPVPEAVHAGSVGTLPGGAEKLRPARVPLIVAERVPGISVPTEGFARLAGPEAVLPDCVAVHVRRSAVPLAEVPSCPVHVPATLAGGSEGVVESPPQPAQATSALTIKKRASIEEL